MSPIGAAQISEVLRKAGDMVKASGGGIDSVRTFEGLHRRPIVTQAALQVPLKDPRASHAGRTAGRRPTQATDRGTHAFGVSSLRVGSRQQPQDPLRALPPGDGALQQDRRLCRFPGLHQRSGPDREHVGIVGDLG